MNMTEGSTMINSYGVPELPQSQYYQPPSQYSPFSQLPSSTSSQNAPTWFIVAVAVAAVIFCYLLYIFVRRQERKAGQSHDESIEVEEEMPDVPKPPAPPSARRLPTEAIPRDVRAETWPDDCPTCKHRGGLYHFKYKCAGCRFKNEWGIHVQFPSGK